MNKATPLRIAMVIQSYLPRLGGAENQLSAICAALRNEGFDPVVITRQYKGMSLYEIINGTPVYRVPAPPPKPLAALCFLVFGLIRIIQLKPNLIHAYELLSPSDLSIMAKEWLNIPLVVKVLRGGWMGDVYKLHNRWPGRIRLQRLKKHANIFIAISTEIKNELLAEGIQEKNCRFIPNGVDISIYKPVSNIKKSGLRNFLNLPNGFLVLYCGRLASEKGLDWLISVWKQFTLRKKASLVIIGDGEEQEKLKALADSSIIFTGHILNLMSYYQAADAFILPSKTEGLSNSLLEAMACGLPVIATSVGAAPELITHGKTGFLISPGNSEELMQRINSLYENPKASRIMGKNGMELIREFYPLKKTVSALGGLYSELLIKKGN